VDTSTINAKVVASCSDFGSRYTWEAQGWLASPGLAHKSCRWSPKLRHWGGWDVATAAWYYGATACIYLQCTMILAPLRLPIRFVSSNHSI